MTIQDIFAKLDESERVRKNIMTIAFALVPAIFRAVGALLLIFGFKITKEKAEKYQAENDARA